MTKHKESSLIGEVFFALCKGIDTPVSLGAWLRFKHNQLALAEMDIIPGDYLDSDAFQADYLVVSFLSKWKGLKTGLNLESEALRRLTSSEVQCRESNIRIREGRNSGHPTGYEQVLYLARRKIARLLGPFSLFKCCPGYGWGPGATDDIRRSAAFVDTKMCQTPISCTATAAGLFTSEVARDPHWVRAIEDYSDKSSSFVSIVRHNVIDTVPKNAKTHRVIAKEPRANGFLQKGVGAYFRERLKHVGVDLDDQTVNQRGASRAYSDRLATIDLKAASDTVSRELVYELLPIDWVLFLEDIRSHWSKLPSGEEIHLEKFSSMGNGFTFELESLIFWALGSGTIDAYVGSLNGPDYGVPGIKTLLVYGDDLIVHQLVAPRFIEVLNYCGFTVNTDKTYIEGEFFESCGKHFFKDVEVTPVYQKDLVVDVLTHIRLSNRLIRVSTRFTATWEMDGRIKPAWLASIRTPWFRKFQLPFGSFGDDGWLVPGSLFTPVRWDQNFGFSCNVLRVLTLPLPGRESALYAHALRRSQDLSSPVPDGFVLPSDFDEPTYGDVEKVTKVACHSHRWVMPTGEFGLD